MESVITRVVINDGAEPEWEAVMRERMTAAEALPGWIGGAILAPQDDPRARVIFGLWDTRGAWEQWHATPTFRETAERLKGLEADPGTATWNTVAYAAGRLQD
jgi:heme-degrading monooxygenase HmoA